MSAFPLYFFIHIGVILPLHKNKKRGGRHFLSCTIFRCKKLNMFNWVGRQAQRKRNPRSNFFPSHLITFFVLIVSHFFSRLLSLSRSFQWTILTNLKTRWSIIACHCKIKLKICASVCHELMPRRFLWCSIYDGSFFRWFFSSIF